MTFLTISLYNGYRMTKPVRVISIFVLFSIFFFSFVQKSNAKTVTFGQLLNGKGEVLPAETDRIKELLAQIDQAKPKIPILDTIPFTNNTLNIDAGERALAPSLSRGQDPQINIKERPTPIPPPPFINNNQTASYYQLSTTDYQLPTFNTTGDLNINPIKTTYTIALLGDSMVDTLGPDLYHLKTLLREAYPAYSFALLNYGQGGTDMDSGLYRLTNFTTYLGKTYPSLLSYRPDILVVESFAYNHWGPEMSDINRHWLTIARIIDTVKANSPDTKIILAATIAPNALTFGDGALNWPQDLKWNSAQTTKAYLQNLTNFATSQNFPLADAYHPSLGPDGNGLAKYISSADHLHPSGDGGWLFAQKIIEAIKNNHLLISNSAL